MHIKQPIRVILALLGILFVVQLVNTFYPGSMSRFGIFPRTIEGLWGIPLAPWIHHNWHHLFSNAAPLAILAFIVLQQGIKRFVLVYLSVSVFAGTAVWLFASQGYHAGASTMVFGLFGYIVSNALFSRNIFNIILATIVCFLYASAIMSLLELTPGISWSSHFFGALMGLIAGRVFHTNSRVKTS